MLGTVPFLIDHHVHLFSPAAKAHLEGEIGKTLPEFSATDLLPVLDADQVNSAAVLSVAYFFDRDAEGRRPSAVRAENDWIADQAVTAGGRIVPFFAVNPLSLSAAPELERCVSLGVFAGVKLHFANSGVRLTDSAHLDRLRSFFALAGSAQLSIVVHLRSNAERYGASEAAEFVRSVLPSAGESEVQIAHAGGWGGYDHATAAALDELIRAVRTNGHHLKIDLSALVRRRRQAVPPYDRLADQLRAIGLERVLFGTDWPDWTPRAYLADLRQSIPLSEDEFAQIIANRGRRFT